MKCSTSGMDLPGLNKTGFDFSQTKTGVNSNLRFMNYPIPYRKKDKWGFSDAEKNILIDCIYDDVIIPFSEKNFDLALVKIGGKQCWIDRTGKQISPLADSVRSFTEDEISILILDENNEEGKQSSENCLFINRFGESVFRLPLLNAIGFHFNNDLCVAVFPNHNYGVINSKGAIVVAPIFHTYEAAVNEIGNPDLYNGYKESGKIQELIKFEKDRCFGFKDRDGHVIFEADYFYASDFENGTAMVASRPKAFYHIDTKGQRLYNKVYYYGFNYDNEIAIVVSDMPDVNPFVHERWGVDYYIPLNARWGYIDKKGQEFWED